MHLQGKQKILKKNCNDFDAPAASAARDAFFVDASTLMVAALPFSVKRLLAIQIPVLFPLHQILQAIGKRKGRDIAGAAFRLRR